MKRTELPLKYRKKFDNIPYIVVATTCPDGSPWNTPVASFHFADDLTIYWASWTENQHSRNIRHNSKAFIVIFDSTPANRKPSTGLYLDTVAMELTDKNEVMIAAKVFGNDPYNPSDGREYLGNKPRRIYKSTPQKIWINTDSKVNDDFVDVRKLIFES